MQLGLDDHDGVGLWHQDSVVHVAIPHPRVSALWNFERPLVSTAVVAIRPAAENTGPACICVSLTLRLPLAAPGVATA
jgi:hypothetical protein